MKPKLRQLAWLFFRVGNTTLGGGDPTVAVLQTELTRRAWLSPGQFGLAYALGRITPGTNMLGFVTAAGWYILGFAGSLAAILAVTIPSSILVLWFTKICQAGGQIPWLGAIVSGAVAASVGLMAASAVRLTRSQIEQDRWILPVLVAAGSFAFRQAGLSPLTTLALAAVGGLAYHRWKPAP